jgi:CheY-like chemotaxis protein
MPIRLLLATPDTHTDALIHELLGAALQLVPLDVTLQTVTDRGALLERAVGNCDDVVLLDWSLAGAQSPDLVRELLALNGHLRIIALLPLHLRQYRQIIWEAGACSSIPLERLDQEWLSSALCLMNRAMQREARVRAAFESAL